MKNVVDSSGWIELFTNGPGAKNFEAAIGDAENLIVPSVSITEVFRFVLREVGEREALTVAAVMRQGQVVSLEGDLALAAASLGHQHRLPLADSIIYATAQHHNALLWTQDADFENLTQVRYFAKK